MDEMRLKDEIALNVLKNLEARSSGYQKQALKQAIENYEQVLETEEIKDEQDDKL